MPGASFPPSRNPLSSPPPESIYPDSFREESPEDPFDLESDGVGGSTDDEGTRQNTLANTARSQPMPQVATGMPPNPFKKTLASLETGSRVGTGVISPAQDSSFEEVTNTKAQYDVNDFKRLLLTGETNVSTTKASTAPTVSFQSPQHLGDSSSNTDTSSASRQSILEPFSAPFHESPRTSQDISPSDDERQQLVGIPPQIFEKSKPSTPRHRHGKSVNANAPQVVSFEDPGLSFSNSGISAASPASRSIAKSQRTSGDKAKPLPPLPSSPHPGDEKIQPGTDTNIVREEFYFDLKASQASPASQKRNPPAPPVSRRHSQLRPRSFASDSGRSTPLPEESSVDSIPFSQSPPSTNSNPPPPPPPRRAGLVHGASSSSIPTSASILPRSDRYLTDDAFTNPPKARPPLPPARSPSISATKRPTQSSATSGSPSIAPLPPPRRRRGSSQSSQTPSALSGEYRTAATERQRSDSGASSISQLQMTSLEPNTEKKDVLADLSALQREVDELRGKFRG